MDSYSQQMQRNAPDSKTISSQPAGPLPSLGPLVAISLSYFVVILDATVLNVALPTLARGLHTTPTALVWVVDGYSLVFAGLLLSAGALGDRWGAKMAFQAGMGLFGLASLACPQYQPPLGQLVERNLVRAGKLTMKDAHNQSRV